MYEKGIKANYAAIERNAVMRTKTVAFILITNIVDKQQLLDLLRAGDED
jgi:hypothetical protein